MYPCLKVKNAVFLLLLFCSPALAAPTVLRHDLRVQLQPAEQAMQGADLLTVRADGAASLNFVLAPSAEILAVTAGDGKTPWSFRRGRLTVELPPALRRGDVPVEIRYRARFADPAPADPINTEDPSYGVAGTIGPQGVFLGGGAGWYPDIPGSTPTMRMEVQMPPEMTAVTAGRLVDPAPGRATWESSHPVRGLALAAGPYRRHENDAGGVPVYAFFYPQSEELAETYLGAATGYLSLYQGLFGPYPFEKFAIAENFFPTGYGFPSWTLLGSSVVRLPFIVETSLGHEIAHSWWGNGVWVDYARGNWSEGLTTYVADYLYQERESAAAAREYRLKILRDYSSLVPPEKDFPLRSFISRTSAASQAIGYGKAAMVFHMARRQVGDQAFWAGLRRVASEKLFRPAAWEDFAAALGRSGDQPLEDFFAQWVDRPGAPVLALVGTRSERTGDGWLVSGRIRQAPPYYAVRVPLLLETAGEEVVAVVESSGGETPFKLLAKDEPLRLVADPEADVFRRLEPSEIPPAVNGLRGSEELLAVAAAGLPPEVLAAARVLLPALGKEEVRIVPEEGLKPADLRGRDLLFLGLPSRRELRPPLPPDMTVTPGGFAIEGQEYAGPGAVLFAALAHPSEPGRTAGLFLPGSASAAATAARKIPHYGKYGYLVFVDGRNTVKGTWPVTASPLIHLFTGDHR